MALTKIMVAEDSGSSNACSAIASRDAGNADRSSRLSPLAIDLMKMMAPCRIACSCVSFLEASSVDSKSDFVHLSSDRP